MTENELSYKIIGVALDLHKTYGPGLLESVYEAAMAYDLTEMGIQVERQVSLPFIHKGFKLETGYRVDMIVNKLVIVEIKSIQELTPIHHAQTLTYLKLSQLKLALLINFNEKTLKNGIRRIVNNL